MSSSPGNQTQWRMIDPAINEIWDVLGPDELAYLQHQVLGSAFEWTWYPGVILPTDITRQNLCVVEQGLNPPQFAHWIDLARPQDAALVRPVLDRLAQWHQQGLRVMRIKFNLLTRSTSDQHHYPHADIDDYENQVYSAIYYVADSDGDTCLFEQFAPRQSHAATVVCRCQPQANKLLIFDSRRFHASTSPCAHDRRCVLNVVYQLLPAQDN